MEMNMTESLEKFNAVTEAYKKEILNLEKASDEGVNLDKIVKSWNILRDLSLQLVTHKSETDLEQETKRKEAETLQEQNIMRENIALIAKAIVIPSVKKYVFSFEKL